MLFSSLFFLFGFLPFVLFVYYALLRKRTHRNIFLFFASILFYAWGEPKFVLVMLLSICANYMFGLLIDKFREDKLKSKLVLGCTLVFNLSLIFIFKYLMFFLTTVNEISGMNFNVPLINLPIGISFFTFQSISYVIDVYKNKGKVQKNLLNVGLYIALFPQLIAGPIVRYETVAMQISERKENADAFFRGITRFLTGLIKKVLISNQVALIADAAFNVNGAISMPFAWLGAIAYALQIYYDFSGYSDMAIGLGKMFGFEFEENFNYPYIAKNITEFWRRWHISLSTWFRDYVYIPLGGSRVGKSRLLVNLLTVWLLTGIWHGASWNFIVWGLYYFVFLVIEKFLFIGKFKESKVTSVIQNTFGRIYAIAVVIFGWVLFRAKDLGSAIVYVKSMLGIENPETVELAFYRFINTKIIFVILGIIFAIPIFKYFGKLIEKLKNTKFKIIAYAADILHPALYISLYLLCIANLMKDTYNPFIYFNF